VPARLPNKLTNPKGEWVQQALDVLMVLRAMERARSEWQLQQLLQQPGAQHIEPR
jgi:hypothetical protein